jgi:dTDP-4-amino-4,6-dideoxygalactose transaminase
MINDDLYVVQDADAAKACLPLYVSQPLLPDLQLLSNSIKNIWKTKQVTNNGPLNVELENKLATFLDAPTAMLFNNGTIGLLTALKLFDLPVGSEVVTTPLTFAATAHSIAWNNLRPVFADVTEHDLTIDPEAVAAAITPQTSAILAVHVYGCICDHEALQHLANAYGLKLIYDAAHAFGAKWKGQSVAVLGDASVFSFHATKLYNTLEGGLLTTPRAEDREKIYLLRNFGIKNEEEVVSIGLNGKMNEVQAAIGILNLDLFETERAARTQLRERYRQIFSGLKGIVLQDVAPNVTQSEQYYLIRIDQDEFGRHRDEIKAELERHNIFCRKYFYPLCTDYDVYRHLPIISTKHKPYAETAKNQVLCLPFHSGVNDAHLDIIADVFYKTITRRFRAPKLESHRLPITEDQPNKSRMSELIVGSENLGEFFHTVETDGLSGEIENGLKVVEQILNCSDIELNNRGFLLEKFLDYGIPLMDSDIFSAFSSAMNKSGFGPIQLPTEFIDFLRRLIPLKITTAAEVGSFRGGSAYFMEAVMQRVKKDFTLTIIDPVYNLIGFDRFQSKLNIINKIPSTSEDFKGEIFDLVFIDGAHDFNGVMKDFENIGKFAAKAVAFHDIHGHEFDDQDGGTVKAWGAIKEQLRLSCEICEYAHSVERSLGIGLAIRC